MFLPCPVNLDLRYQGQQHNLIGYSEVFHRITES